MSENNSLRVVCLFSKGIVFEKSLSIFLENKINIVGVCYANKHKKGVDFSYLKIAIKKNGIYKVFLQILERILYKIINTRKDKIIFDHLYNEKEINNVIKDYKGEIYHTEDYQEKNTIQWLESLEPDVFIIHTGYWVGKKVRAIVKGKCLGGHPGITPNYRGVHSPFWAIYNGEPEKVGYSVFWVNSGVDTGDIIHQENIPINKGDSYFTLSWKGMIGIAENQAKITLKLQNKESLEVKKVGKVSNKTNYTHPTIFQYIKYRFKQKLVR